MIPLLFALSTPQYQTFFFSHCSALYHVFFESTEQAHSNAQTKSNFLFENYDDIFRI